jgi:hypothetical protein
MLFVSENRLSPDSIRNFRDAWEHCEATGRPLLLDKIRIYQLIDGQWLPLNPSDPEPTQEEIEGGAMTGQDIPSNSDRA